MTERDKRPPAKPLPQGLELEAESTPVIEGVVGLAEVGRCEQEAWLGEPGRVDDGTSTTARSADLANAIVGVAREFEHFDSS